MVDDLMVISKPEELLIMLNLTQADIHLELNEAELLLAYMEGSDYELGLRNGELVRHDIAEEPGEIQQGSRGCIPEAPGETGIHLEWKQRTPLCSRIATGISWSSLGGLKGVKPPEAFGERSRDWSLGHAGDEGPHLSMTGDSRGCSQAAAPGCGLSRGTTARSVSLSWGAREVGSPCEYWPS